MEDKLKHYIMAHRNELDVFAPAPSVWEKINDGLANIAPAPTTTGATGSWLKYLLLTVSVVTIVAVLVLRKNKPSAKNVPPYISIDTAINKDTTAKETIVAKIDEPILAVQKTNENPVFDSLQPLSPSPILLGKTPSLQIGRGVSFFEYPEPTFSPFTNQTNTSAPKNIGKVTEIKERGKNSYQETVDTSFLGITKIEVEGSFCDVKIVQGKQEQLTVKGEIKIDKKGLFSNSINKHHITCTKTGNTLVVKITDDENGSWKNNFVVGSYELEGHLDIELPLETNNVKAETYSGTIEAKDFTGNMINLNTSSGNIKASIIRSPLIAKTYSGNIQLTQVWGDVTTESSSGNQGFFLVKGNQTSQSYSGNINITAHTGDAKIQSSSGNQTYANLDGNLHATSYSGNIILTETKGDLQLSTSSGDIAGVNLELTGNSDFKTYSGNIDADLKNKFSDLSFELQTYSGNLSVNNGSQSFSGERQLNVKQGSLLVKGSTSSGSQRFR